MPGTPTTPHGIPTLDEDDVLNDGPSQINAALQAVANKIAVKDSGPLSNRPVSTSGSPGIEGRLYRATDTGHVFYDTGTSWLTVYGPPESWTVQNAGFDNGWGKEDTATALRYRRNLWRVELGGVLYRTTSGGNNVAAITLNSAYAPTRSHLIPCVADQGPGLYVPCLLKAQNLGGSLVLTPAILISTPDPRRIYLDGLSFPLT